MKTISFYASFNERTGYGVHACRLAEALEKITTVYRNKNGGDVYISLVDSVSVNGYTARMPYPSILYNVWESDQQPSWFMERLSLFDQLWVPSHWQQAASIAQGVPEEYVKVVPEGVDPEKYKPLDEPKQSDGLFNFVHVGQWQPRKSSLEIVQSFLKAFPDNPNVRLYLSVDTLYPSDNFKSTEERLVAYGINDSRICVVHFEERDAYIRRLQSADCFVSCSRSEGWGLPIIEAIASGVPTIVADWGGSTEYAYDAINVHVPKLRKPVGIYGNWDVPGNWGEPDYDDLVAKMQDVYSNYPAHKEKALKNSEMVRTKFSWDAAAKKVMETIDQIPEKKPVIEVPPIDLQKDVELYARERGFEIKSMVKPRNAIFTIDSHPADQDRLDCLIETIKQIKSYGYPVLLTSHYPLPALVIEMADYYIYDKKDPNSGDDMPTYWRTLPDGRTETTPATIPCHALAAITNVRNGVDFCKGKYDWIYQMCYDTEIDLGEWLKKVNTSDKDIVALKWSNEQESVSGQILAAKIEYMDIITPRIPTWEEFARIYGNERFLSEKVTYQVIQEKIGFEKVDFITMEISNRFSQVDYNAWKTDIYVHHFIDGAFLQIGGMSKREYDVIYSNPVDGDCYVLKQKVNMWSRSNKKFYCDWLITVKIGDEIYYQKKIDLKDKRVLISMGSKALGDTLAWIPYVEEFRKKHGCKIICSSWWNKILDYPEFEFVEPGTSVQDIFACYEIGCFDNQPDKNPKDWRTIPLQQVASDILGLEYTPIRAKLKTSPKQPKEKKYICFSEFSTMQNKMWNNEGAWQKVIDYLNSLGYECWSISAEKSSLKNIVDKNNQTIEQTIENIANCDFYVGLNHGPSWIAYSLGIPYIMITGVSAEWNDAPNPYRISIDTGCTPCFNDTRVPIGRSREWCCNKDNRFICTKAITAEMVILVIDKLIKENKDAIT